jgi:hypothetical protein
MTRTQPKWSARSRPNRAGSQNPYFERTPASVLGPLFLVPTSMTFRVLRSPSRPVSARRGCSNGCPSCCPLRVLGLRGGHRDDTGRAALGLYREAHSTSSPHWSFLPASLLPICYWGWDPNPGPVDRQALFPQPLFLAEWLDRWVRRWQTRRADCAAITPAPLRAANATGRGLRVSSLSLVPWQATFTSFAA